MAGELDFFNSPEMSSTTSYSQDPFFTMKGKSEQELLKWLKESVKEREKFHEDFFKKCRCHLTAYAGKYFKTAGRQSDSLEYRPSLKTSKYFVNHLYEMTENLVSRMTRVKPAVEIIPSNDEYEDKNAAKSVKLLLQHLWYINDTDTLTQKVHRQKYIFGESYLNIDWDKTKGDLHPDYVNKKDLSDSEIKELHKEGKLKTGDVCYSIELPWEVLPECGNDYSKTKSIILTDCKHIEEIKYEYPGKDIKADKDLTSFSLTSMKDETLSKHVKVHTFYYKADEHFPKGKKIIFTNNVILSDEDDIGFSHGDFPVIRLTDIDIPGQLHGMSRYEQTLILQNAHNNLSQSIMKNEFLMAAPKWVMPRGAAKLEQLANGRTVIQYQGAVPPQLVQMNPTSPTSFNFRDKTEIELGTIMGVHQVSRGEPPKGITAAVALQFLNEQETERAISDIAKHNNFIVEMAKKSISVAGDHYQVDDGRMLRLLGKENKYLIKYFDTANLHKDYDIKIQNSSALPESKSARMERILQTMQYAPTLFTQERWAELLEFGSTEKMHTLITEAIQAAESECEDLLEGNPVEEPKEWEDLIIHLRVHYKKMQARSFKEDVSFANRMAFIQHVKVTEMLAAQRAQTNPLFASKLAQLEQYPMFWKAPVPPSREQSEMLVQGQANMGMPITAAVPAQEPGSFPGEAINKGE